MKPIFIQGNSIAETWENALVALWRDGIDMETQYDIDPNTGFKHPPSKDCMLMMEVKNALAEPRLHVCLEGGPAELAEYKLEVVDGIKDHWVKQRPEDTEWTYTYHNRLFNWGNQLNFASLAGSGEIDPENPWTQLAYVRKAKFEDLGHPDNGLRFELIEPKDQIQHIIDSIVEAPFTRRAVALTGFPAGDAETHDPPCLRYVWVRGNYEKNHLSIDMHTHWRSRDLWGAALFNMYALTELQRYIINKVQEKFGEMYVAETLDTDKCPRCGDKLGHLLIGLEDEREYAKYVQCNSCKLSPYKVKAGRYVDISDSAHVYGHKLKEFENRFINSALQQPKSRRFWHLSEMKDLIQEGEERAYKMVASLDEKKNRVGLPAVNKTIIKYH